MVVDKDESSKLHELRIKECLGVRVSSLLDSIAVFAEIDSTQTYVKTLGDGVHVCIADQQTAGRGRRQRDWVSQAGRDVLMSLSWQFPSWPKDIAALGLALAARTAHWLNQDCQLSVQVKWPNDLLLHGAKLAGMLVDVSGEPQSQCRVVVGMGLNVNSGGQRDSVDQRWTDMSSHSASAWDRNQLAAGMIDAWVDVLQSYCSNGWVAYRNLWIQYAAFLGQEVTVGHNGEYRGKLVGVDETGQLLVQTNDQGQVAIYDAELSLRPVSSANHTSAEL